MEPPRTDTLYETFDKSLYRTVPILGDELFVNNLRNTSSSDESGITPDTRIQATGSLQSGKKTFDDTASGYILGFDPKDRTAKFSIGNTSNYLTWDGSDLNIKGTFTIGGVIVTVDDIANLQSAIDAVSTAGGGTIALVPDTYMATATITVPSNMTIEGNGSTIDFGGGAFQFLIQGSNAYSTGTVSINYGSSTVVGVGTTWTAAMVGRSILIGDYWYVITARTDNTHITIEYSSGNGFMGTDVSGVSYVIATTVDGASINNMTLTNSSITALRFRYVNGFNMNALVVTNSAQAIDGDDSANVNLQGGYAVDDCVVGITYDNVPFCVFVSGLISNITGGTGLALTGVTNTALNSLSIRAVTGVGTKLTNCSNFGYEAWSTIECSSHGLELVSGNNDVDILSGYVSTCGGDGIKITATSDRNTIVACSFLNNTGYGVNVAASTCDNNNIVSPVFSGNIAGTIGDSGTSTVVIAVAPDVFSFGDGSDGNVVISVPTTLTRDMYYNNLTLSDTLNTANYRVFVKGTISGAGTLKQIGNNGTVGSNAAAGVGGAGGGGGATIAGYLTTQAGATGGKGGDASNQAGTVGGTGASPANSLGINGVTGGAGGASFGSTSAGGGGGPAGVPTATVVRFPVIATNAINMLDITSTGSSIKVNSNGGSGGGGGGGAHTATGGGGGGGAGSDGGIIMLFCKIWAGTFTIQTTGGNGANGGTAVNGGGGGGGGGGDGGTQFIIYQTKTWTGSYSRAGGTGGTGGTSSAGTAGSNGTTGTTGVSFEVDIATLTR